ncbi:hypothetical protein [Brevibacterium jeotgali]|uniref:TIGR03089 family protein n=1 Tax=Brevibacterium jeotgali TaxID=1262550 RepID=A0A2H1L662_9MICO|nr:hypothetical protein [Brevibacterium jeotgali]TWC03574.1 hypothetical protein FB108_2306 [Brevibacterium jeotgali]SMY12397.1 hypothetical protein BJEO58_01991 [Brevibacterium jeotgali]
MRTYLAALAELRRPVLRWEGPDGASLELTGPVLANWAHKAHGLLADSEVGPDLDLGIVDSAGLHWRALTGALAAWSLGACVRIVADEEPQSGWAALASEHRAEDPVTHSADEVFVFPIAPLALSVDAPVDTIDYATALRTHPDEAPVGALASVSFGDAATTESAAFAGLTEQAPAASDSHSTEVVVTEAPRSTTEWGRVLAGLLHGLVVLRQVD